MKFFAKLKAVLTLLILACLSLLFTGCNAYQTAQRAHDIVASVVAVAQADLPSLQAAGVFTPTDGVVVSGYLALATNLNAQYETCITNANTAALKTSGKFLACLKTFSAGLRDSSELEQLRVMSPKAQQEAQLWITATSVAINSVIAALGGNTQSVPQVAAVEPTPAELHTFARHVGYAVGF